jgi:hypothetical protein
MHLMSGRWPRSGRDEHHGNIEEALARFLSNRVA